MVEQKPVTIKWQIIFTFIPFLNLYAFYKIQKLRLFLCFFMPISITSRFVDAAFSTQMLTLTTLYLSIILTILFSGLAIGLSIWFVLKWSKQWNEKFS